AQEVIAVTIGDPINQDILRSALARGAQRAILITTEHELSPLTVARALAKVVEQENPQLVLLGKQAIDSDNQQVGQMLAGLLDWPQASYASKVKIDNTSIEVSREVDAGIEVLNLQLPAVVTADLRLNEPRYLSLPNIMKAKQKPITQIRLEELGITPQQSVEILNTSKPAARKAGSIVPDVKTLVDKLHNEARVI
ncbi:MAG: electron transfer flavoprotein subunit beta/FixA family protein, partial [Gammaproteobacteria bacterium]